VDVVAIGSLVATVVLSGVLLWIRPGGEIFYSRATLAIFFVCSILFVIIGRTFVRAAWSIDIAQAKISIAFSSPAAASSLAKSCSA